MSSNWDKLAPTANDIKMMALADVQISTKKVEPCMKNYVYGKAKSGLDAALLGCAIIDLRKTWAKLVLAAQVLASVENPKTIYCVGQRLYCQRSIIKFADQIGATAKPGRFTAGQFSNQITKQFVEPRILVVADPRIDSQAVKEASYVNIPTIAFCGADSKLECIDIAIPGNNRGKDSLGLLYWMLAREVLRLRGSIAREEFKNDSWASKTPPDLFFYKDIEELEKQQAEEAENEQFAEDEQGFEANYNEFTDGQAFNGQEEWDPQSTVNQNIPLQQETQGQWADQVPQQQLHSEQPQSTFQQGDNQWTAQPQEFVAPDTELDDWEN